LSAATSSRPSRCPALDAGTDVGRGKDATLFALIDGFREFIEEKGRSGSSSADIASSQQPPPR